MPACTFVPEFAYEDIGVAIDFLRAAFGFEVRWRAGDHRAQLAFADGAVAVAEASSSRVLRGPQSIIVRVADVDAHCRWARGAGAAVLAEPQDFHYGERQYTAEDPGGHHWTFSQTIADLTPEQWGGTSGSALV
jgi:uncharacterized glyoxalase superfamily protein PhnB